MVAVIYILTIMLSVSFVLHKVLKEPLIIQWAGIWIALTFIEFFVGNTAILLLSIMFACIYFSPPNPALRVAYFFALYPAVPDTITWLVPGPPGVNYLFFGTAPMFAQLGLFGPMLLLLIDGKGPDRRKLFYSLTASPIERWAWYYFLFSVILSIVRMSSVSVAMRECFSHFSWMFPFFVIARSIRNFDDFKMIMKGVLYGACVVACLGIFERMRNWNPFFSLPRSLHIEAGYLVPLMRGGYLRVQSSLTQAIVFGYYMAMAIGVAWFCYCNVHKSKIYLLGTVGIVALASAFSISKSSWLAGIVMIVGMLIFQIKKSNIRNFIILVLLIGGMAGYIELTTINKGETVDSGGAVASDFDASVNYRKRLVEAGLITIQDNILFGSPKALENPAMQSMRQGQGIIDLVNVYISIALFKGVVGLFLFVMLIFASIKGVYDIIKDEVTPESEVYRGLGALLISSIAGTSVMINSMSELGVVHDYFWALFAFCAAFQYIFIKEKIIQPNGKVTFVIRERFPRKTAVAVPSAMNLGNKPAPVLGVRS